MFPRQSGGLARGAWPKVWVVERAFFLHRVREYFLCKLSLRLTLRHRLSPMSYLRFKDEDESSIAGTVAPVLLGALAGFAVGMIVAQRVGGFKGIADRVRRRGAGAEDTELAGPSVADDFAD